MRSIYSETKETLSEQLQKIKEPTFRSTQILEWLYKKRISRFEDMTNLSQKLRNWLIENYSISKGNLILKNTSRDVTNKLLLKMSDESLIETVIIRAPQEGVGVENSRKTICISTQVGCAYGCKFCASGLAGWKRDLTSGEIVSQLMQVCELEDPYTDRKKEEIASFDNIVVMGMGEPLANYENLIQALRIVNAKWGLNFGARRVTISTSGVVPSILKLAEEPFSFRLAVSLHGATNEVRQKIMPVNRKYPLEELLPAIKSFSSKHGRMVTLEFILIQDVNDSLDQAKELSKIANDLHAHVNLIPYNNVEGLDWIRPPLNKQQSFAKVLSDHKVSVTLRKEKGHDIDAACGQLRLKKEKDGALVPATKGNR